MGRDTEDKTKTDWALYLRTSFVLSLVAGIIVRFENRFYLWDVEVSPGLIFFPLAYSILALYTWLFGYKKSQTLIFIGLPGAMIATLASIVDFIASGGKLAPGHINALLSIFVISITIGQFATAFIVHKFRSNPVIWWGLIRLFIAPFVGILLTTVVTVVGDEQDFLTGGADLWSYLWKRTIFLFLVSLAYAPALYLLLVRVSRDLGHWPLPSFRQSGHGHV